MLYFTSTVRKLAFAFAVAIFLLFLGADLAQAATADAIQPASDVVYGERLRVNSAISVANSSYYYQGIHLGSTDGTGGVIFANGSIINASTGSIPVTFGDDTRIDGRIWRGPSAGPGDSLPVKIYDDLRVDGAIWAGSRKGNAVDGQSVVFADSIRPEEDNKNVFGSNGYRWASGDFAGTVNVGGLGGDDVINENNLQSTNNPTSGYILAYTGNNQFRWVPASDSNVLTGLHCASGQIIKYNGTAWACAADDGSSGGSDTDWSGAGSGTMYASDTGDNVGIGKTSSLNGKLHVEASASGAAAVYGYATHTGTPGNYGGHFRSAGQVGQAVRGEALHSSGVNIGGYFTSSSTAGFGVFGGSSYVGVNGFVTPAAGASFSAGSYGQLYTANATIVPITLSGKHGGYFLNDSADSGDTAVTGIANSNGINTNYGGYFLAHGGAGIGLFGGSTGATSTGVQGSGVALGGNFSATGTGAIGLQGASSAGSGSNVGVSGTASSGKGVEGTGTTHGGDFTASSNTGIGVYGEASDATGPNYGGSFKGTNGFGVKGEAVAGTGVWGVGTIYGGSFSSSGASGSAVYAAVANSGAWSGNFSGGSFTVALHTSGTPEFTIENILTTASAANVNIDASGNVRKVSSSIRYKENVRDLDIVATDVLQLQGVKFNEKSTGKEEIGFIAEDVYETVPDLVVLKNGRPESVKYDRVPAYLLEVAKEQQSKISVQEDKINDQQNKISVLENEVSSLKSVICKYLPQEEVCQE